MLANYIKIDAILFLLLINVFSAFSMQNWLPAINNLPVSDYTELPNIDLDNINRKDKLPTLELDHTPNISNLPVQLSLFLCALKSNDQITTKNREYNLKKSNPTNKKANIIISRGINFSLSGTISIQDLYKQKDDICTQYICEACGKSDHQLTKSKDSILRHFFGHINFNNDCISYKNKKSYCHICNKIFRAAKSLTSHLEKNHTIEEKEKFIQNADLHLGINIYKADKRYDSSKEEMYA